MGRGRRNVRIELWWHGGGGIHGDGSNRRKNDVVRIELRVRSVVKGVRSFGLRCRGRIAFVARRYFLFLLFFLFKK